MSLLDVNGLCIRYGDSEVVSGLSFGVGAGESLGLVGESGSGKTQTALAILGLLPATASVEGSITVDRTEVVGADDRALNRLRAEKVGIVFQDPMQALNPYVPIGAQLRRILVSHGLADGREADQRAMHMLDRVGLPDPGRQFRAYAHQLSGGMRQRVMIASALIAQPALLIADEPTTAYHTRPRNCRGTLRTHGRARTGAPGRGRPDAEDLLGARCRCNASADRCGTPFRWRGSAVAAGWRRPSRCR